MTPVMVKTSEGIVGGLIEVVSGLGQILRDRIYEEIEKNQIIEQEQLESVKEIGHSSLSAAVTIWDSLQYSGSMLLNSTVDATTDVVAHKFGEEVGTTVKDSCQIGKDFYDTVTCFKGINAEVTKGIIKNAVRENSRFVVEKEIMDLHLLQLTAGLTSVDDEGEREGQSTYTADDFVQIA
eukprot:TRINITY_DN3218_c0_g1_i27.p1 TRINITY_DN3218_c0_g1~~TRINITY_DN3218_c0_g1_i27.p1  ORF type:complete len:180 (-),score=41.27 TRINITY_DN3218_c0_g1_i27:191-730(-)